MKQPRIIIMAGGTGGHIFPGLAVAEALAKAGWEIHWLGSKNGMEEKLVNADFIALHLVSVKGLRGNGLVGWLKAPWMLCKAVSEARKVLKQTKVDLAIGFGGFASGPGGLATKLVGVPLMLHEQNARAGMTNQYLARIACKIFEGFPKTFDSRFADKTKTVGNPIRREILAIKKQQPAHQLTRVLVIGGSRGAVALNENLPAILLELAEQSKLEVWHQTGAGKADKVQADYGHCERVKVSEFIEDMQAAYQWADLVICRAGASTVAEIAAVGIAAIFVPYPYAVDDHQSANANWLVQTGGASLLKQTELESGEKGLINAWIKKSPRELYQLGQLNKQQAFTHATADIVDCCEQMRSQAA